MYSDRSPPSHERTSRFTTILLPNGSSDDALPLTVPYPHGTGRIGLGLTPKQLRSLVEFLSTASPRDIAKQTLYVSFLRTSAASSKRTWKTSRVVDTVEELRSAWRGEASGDEMGVIRDLVFRKRAVYRARDAFA